MVLGRACRSVLLADRGSPRNSVSPAMHGFLTRDGMAPEDFRQVALQQLRPYDVQVPGVGVAHAERSGSGFKVVLDDGRKVRARRLILATGVVDQLPTFEGVAEIWGTSAHHCPFCDGWEWRGKRCAVLAPQGGVEQVLTLMAWTPHVTLLTDGNPKPREGSALLKRYGVTVRTGMIRRAESHGGWIRRMWFEDGSSMELEALFFDYGTHQASDLPRELHCSMTSEGLVKVNEFGCTSTWGVYAAGDLTPGPQGAIMAAAEGARAAASVHQSMRGEEIARRPRRRVAPP